jgi:lysyl-tRNA synthetase, class II
VTVTVPAREVAVSHPHTEREDQHDERRDDPRVHRLAKLDALRAQGQDPYPYRFDRSHTAAEVRGEHSDLPPGTETDHRVTIAGRVMLIRRQGKLIFATLRDRTGELQLFVSKGGVADEAFAAFDALDLGDWVGATGTVMSTRRGELSVRVESFQLLAKALRPLPDKWKGLTDTDTRYRQRYADLIVNDEARRVFEVRHRLVASFRRTLDEHGFVEVETPVLHVEAGGAHARPFTTHHNTLDMQLYLRIALELHLKRLIVGGMERVYEIGRVFRNEGISPRHNPEFTMLELYQAFADYTDVMAITEELIRRAAVDASGSSVVRVGDSAVDLGQPWPRVDLLALVDEHTGARVHPSMAVDDLRRVLDDKGVPYESWMGPGALCFELYDVLVERHLAGPVFVTRYPVEVSPLARVDRADPLLTERFELVVNGRELANGYSELNDPVVQRRRFEDEQRVKDAGNLEAGSVDEDYLRALEYGMPPTGGLGIGIDRLAMLLAGVPSIKEVILFPTLRPEQGLDAPLQS